MLDWWDYSARGEISSSSNDWRTTRIALLLDNPHEWIIYIQEKKKKVTFLQISRYKSTSNWLMNFPSLVLSIIKNELCSRRRISECRGSTGNSLLGEVFRCVLASLHEGLSVRPSVRPSVRRSVRRSVRPSVGHAFVENGKIDDFDRK